MLMIPQTHPCPSPRFAPARIIRQHEVLPTRTSQTSRTKHLLTRTTLVATNAWLQNLFAQFTSFRRAPARWPPSYKAMSLYRFRTWPFELDAEFAQETGMPFVFVCFQQTVCLFVGEEV